MSPVLPNTDPLRITMPVNVAEAVADCLDSLLDQAGDDDRLRDGVNCIRAALSSVPILTLSASVGPAEPAFPEPSPASPGLDHLMLVGKVDRLTAELAEARRERDGALAALAESVAARDAAERSCDAAVERADRADRVVAELRRDLGGMVYTLNRTTDERESFRAALMNIRGHVALVLGAE